jgi:hypothetical protein
MLHTVPTPRVWRAEPGSKIATVNKLKRFERMLLESLSRGEAT